MHRNCLPNVYYSAKNCEIYRQIKVVSLKKKSLKMSDTKSSRRRKYSSSSESSVDSAENERRKDLLERDEFANRLKKKDDKTTRKVLEVSIKWLKDLLGKNDYKHFVYFVFYRRREKKDLKRQQSVSKWSSKIVKKLFQICVYNRVDFIWKSVKKTKSPSWKPILWTMNICSMIKCKCIEFE